MLALPHGAAETAGIAFLAAHLHDRMARQIGREMLRHRDRAHAGAAAAVRDRERLVQVQMTDIGADRGRAGEPHLRVHVGAVHVDLSAVLVDDRRRSP